MAAIKRSTKWQAERKEMQLTTQQKNKLQQHATHHTKKHMQFMRQRMRAGDTFNQAHQKAKNKVGK